LEQGWSKVAGGAAVCVAGLQPVSIAHGARNTAAGTPMHGGSGLFEREPSWALLPPSQLLAILLPFADNRTQRAEI
jgi:hypothetical protein